MELTGKIIAALDAREGTSSRTGSTWKSQEFVIETHDQYPRKCVFTVFGEERLQQFNIQVGEEMTVSFDIDAHEWNGRWFNDIRAWKVDRNMTTPVDGVAPTDPGIDAPFPTPTEAPEEGSADDLPF